MSLSNLNHFLILITLTLNILEEGLVLLDSFFFLFNAHFLGLKDFQLLSLSLNFCITLLVVISQFCDIWVTLAHYFCVVVEEGGILNQALLQLVIFFSKLAFTSLEFKLLLSEVLLFSDESLLILVHLATLIKQASRRWLCLKFLRRDKALLFYHSLFYSNLN